MIVVPGAILRMPLDAAALLAQAGQAQATADEGKTLLQHILSGGPIGIVIILLSFTAVLMAVWLAAEIRLPRLAPPRIVEGLDRLLAANDVRGALAFCQSDENRCLLTGMFAAALTRCLRSPFGLLELRSALEEAGQERFAKLQRKTDPMGLIAAVAPMLGLLGTVVGLVGAFETLSVSEGVRPEALASSISVALITTVLGLIVAIPSTALHSFYRNRVDALAQDVAELTEELAARIQSAKPAGGAAPSPAGRPPVAASSR
ncbi:MAG: MotA/TolQ/ExbB proton channel family protein [Phycisphaerales bacterium]|jgi:biopolymer transport protein ExbB